MFSKFRIIVFFFLFLSFLPSEVVGQHRRTLRADKAFEQKQYHEAITQYRKAYNKVGSKNRVEGARLVFQLAKCYRLTNNQRQAEPWFLRATRLGYPDPKAYLYLADAQMSNEKFEDALKHYRRYQELVPDDPLGGRGIESAKMALEGMQGNGRYVFEAIRSLNSRYDDFTPAFGDRQNNSLVFASSREGAIGERKDPWTGGNHTSLFVSFQDRSGAWSNPVLLDEGPLNTEFNEGAPSLNSTGTEMFFTRCLRSPDADLGCRIYSSRREGSQWGTPREVVLVRDSLISVGHPAISPDELELFFVSDMPGGQGGKDIWVSRRRAPGDSFGPPQNLGPEINTPADEMFPYLRDDGTLYFSSDGHPGYGGLDIFSSVRSPEGWSKPQNLGIPFNSPGDDFGIVFSFQTERGFLSSNRRGSRGYDLYSFMLPPLEFEISGTVRDENTRAILTGATVQLVGSDGTLVQAETDSRGMYVFGKNLVRENTHYDLLVSKERYFSVRTSRSTENITSSNNFVHDFLLAAIPKTPVTLPEILYEFGSWELQPQFKDSLNFLIRTLEDNPNIVIELASHTDSRGTDALNDTLSQRRAQAVVEYLIENRIDPARLEARGYGKRVPRVIEKDLKLNGLEIKAGTVLNDAYINSLRSEQQRDAAHQLNRRTEFRVIGEDFKPPAPTGQPRSAGSNQQPIRR